MSMVDDMSWGSEDNEQACEFERSDRFSVCKKGFHQENGHFSDLDQKRSSILLLNAYHKENGTESLNR